MRLRIKFKKYGPVRFIGHLDLMRFFQKAIRRAQIDVAYTEGFSPHQVMAFAAPLGVGLTSNGEYMDIEVNSITSCQDIMERLNRASVYGIEVISVKILPDTAGNAMASVAAAAYTVRFREGRAPKVSIDTILPDFLARKQILFTRKTKKGLKEVDLRQGIYRLRTDSSESVYMLVNASSGGNIKPIHVMEALLEQKEEAALRALEKEEENSVESSLLITREELYTNTGTEAEPRFLSLDEIGKIEE